MNVLQKIMKIIIMFTNIHVVGLTLVVQMIYINIIIYIITDNYGIGYIGRGEEEGRVKIV